VKHIQPSIRWCTWPTIAKPHGPFTTHTFAVNPGHTKLNDALWLEKDLELVETLRVALEHGLKREQHLSHSLLEIPLVGVALAHGVEDSLPSHAAVWGIHDNT